MNGTGLFDWALLISLIGLTVTIIIGASRFGRLIGGLEKVVEMMGKSVRKNSIDIDSLWRHQRVQDERCAAQCELMAAAVERLTAVASQVKDIHDHYLKRGLLGG